MYLNNVCSVVALFFWCQLLTTHFLEQEWHCPQSDSGRFCIDLPFVACALFVFPLVNHHPLCPPGQWAIQRTTTVWVLQEASGCYPTETPQPASPRPPPAWSASPRWGHLESLQVPLYATDLHPTGVCVWSLFSELSSVPSLILIKHVQCYS